MNLSDDEIKAIEAESTGHAIHSSDAVEFARAIIAATIAKLSQGVSVKPDYQRLVYKATGGDRTPDPEDYRDYYKLETLQTAIAAARVQAINECAEVCASAYQGDLAKEIRALIGGRSV